MPQEGGYPASPGEWTSLLSRLSDSIRSDSFSFSGLRRIHVRNKPTFTTSVLEDTLVLRKINENLRRSYNLSQPSRGSLVKAAKQALGENIPKSICRIDIRGCFESLNASRIIRQLGKDGKVSQQTLLLLQDLIEKCKALETRKRSHGLPRGLIVSTSLAEYALRNLDANLRLAPGVYLVLRYVDDILVFSTAKPRDTYLEVARAIGSIGLRVNRKKTQLVRISCKCEDTCNHVGTCPCAKSCKCASVNQESYVEIEYLGYSLIAPRYNSVDVGKANQVFCMLSARKVSRIKSRIYRAFAAFRATNDTNLLTQRMRYLTANQVLEAPQAKTGLKGLISGLSYTHSEYPLVEVPKALPIQRRSLHELDRFYRTLLRKHSQIITPNALGQLEALTFFSGFVSKRRTRFTGTEVNNIKACWANV